MFTLARHGSCVPSLSLLKIDKNILTVKVKILSNMKVKRP